MIARDPDITRLLDRMERSDLVVRRRSVDDRRIVLAMLHPHGNSLLNEADQPLRNVNTTIMGKLGEAALLSLISALELVREDG